MGNSDAIGRFRAALSALCLYALTASCAHDAAVVPAAGSGLHEALMDVYAGPLDHLHGVRRGGCPMHPSCSEYSRQAIARFGFARGWVMTTDRLMRCGRDEMRLSRAVRVDGGWKIYDPVDENDFWGQAPPPTSGGRRPSGDGPGLNPLVADGFN